MNEQMQKLITNLIQIEHVSTTLYLAMSAYLANQNYIGLASWLRAQSEEERTHLLKLNDHLTECGEGVDLQALPAQQKDFGTPLETFQKVLKHERFVTEPIEKFMNEEAQSKTIVDRLTLARNNTEALLVLDQELGQRAPVAAAGGAAAGG
ncbi:ferritin [Rossellomorea marisflavi]|uniref:Ferritin n=1 Tax=Rossellomorea marisflavi TaxID=189381 RepID=A0A5D4RED5_9BACI|nr:ferritin [Rossellomorea marisflavi]TYS48226.1 ferritin [Rossellomorea marisflavi]